MTAVYKVLAFFMLAMLWVPSLAHGAGPLSPIPVKILSFPIPPLLHMTADGDFSGTIGETVKALCEEQNLDCSFRVVPLARAYLELKKGDGDALITLNLGQFKTCCAVSAWSSPWSAGFFSTLPPTEIPHSEEDLIGKSMIAVNGMKSPYLFAPNLDDLAEKKKVNLSKARNISLAAQMFISKRSPLLWGSEDFSWYFEKLGSKGNYNFVPKVSSPIVVWVRKEKAEVLQRFDRAFAKLKAAGILNERGLLRDDLMASRYKDAPFSE